MLCSSRRAPPRFARSHRPRREADATYVALLRGVNVGGRNRLPMKELIAMFSEAGCRNVQSYIQSGNILRCPNGMARTKLTTQYFDSRLKTACTVRNWTTVLRLLDLVQGT